MTIDFTSNTTTDWISDSGTLGQVTFVYQPTDTINATILQLNATGQSTTESGSGSGGTTVSDLTVVGGSYEIGLVVNQANSTSDPILVTALTITIGGTAYTVPVDGGVFLSDNPNGAGSPDYGLLIPTDLFAGATGSSTVTITATIQDANGGPERFVTLTPTFVANPEISVTKDTFENGHNVDGGNVVAGQAIEWDYAVTNTGNVALAGATLALTDDNGTPGVGHTGDDFAPAAVMGGVAGTTADASHNYGDVNNNGLLDVGETWLFTAPGSATSGPYTNTVSVSDTYNGAPVTGGASSSYTGVDPAISITKDTQELVGGAWVSVAGATVVQGQHIQWVYDVTNTGDVAIDGSTVLVTDNNGTASTTDDFNPTAVMGGVAGTTADASHNYGDVNNNGVLDVGETWVYSQASTAGDGPYSNSASAAASYTDGGGYADPLTTDPATSSYTGVAPAISISKVTVDGAVSGDGIIAKVGDSISWKYSVTNTGDVGIKGSTITVTDNNGTAATADDFHPAAVMGGVAGTLADASHNYGDVNNNGVLDPGETWVYSQSGTAILGSYSNIGSVTASYTDGGGYVDPLSASDGSSYAGTFTQSGQGLSAGYWFNHGSDPAWAAAAAAAENAWLKMT